MNVNIRNNLGAKGSIVTKPAMVGTPPAPATSTTVTGSFIAVQAVTDAVFNSIDGNISGISDAITLPAGQILHGKFSEVDLKSGTIVTYG